MEHAPGERRKSRQRACVVEITDDRHRARLAQSGDARRRRCQRNDSQPRIQPAQHAQPDIAAADDEDLGSTKTGRRTHAVGPMVRAGTIAAQFTGEPPRDFDS
jgi:hypothetical protein